VPEKALRRRYGAEYKARILREADQALFVKDVLDKLLAGCSDYHSLRPDVWKESHPEAVRIYRQDERRHRAEAKSIKRAKRRLGRK